MTENFLYELSIGILVVIRTMTPIKFNQKTSNLRLQPHLTAMQTSHRILIFPQNSGQNSINCMRKTEVLYNTVKFYKKKAGIFKIIKQLVMYVNQCTRVKFIA